MNKDIVYILKNNLDDTELIYSIRSVCQNFPFRNIWFAGGTPQHVSADGYLPMKQDGGNKWFKVTNTIKRICKVQDISDDFWLFNDDFFIMRPCTTSLPPLLDGTIERRINEIKNRQPQPMSKYAEQLFFTEKLLKSFGYDTLNYAVHTPMLINKNKALNTIYKFPNSPMFRSLYGNQHRIGGTLIEDVKIYNLDQKPTGDEYLLSTTDDSFREGRVGKYIRDAFPEKCKYEIERIPN